MSEEKTKRKLLIADDDVDICEILGLLLKEEFDVHVVHRGDEAFEYIKEHKPDIVISDLVMPRMDGLAICEHVKSDPDLKHIIVIIITATTSDKELPDKVWQMATGADAFITKPFDATKVVEKVLSMV